MKGLTDKYETDELHIPNMFQGTVKVYYLTVITILSLIVILLWIFFKRPFFEASSNIQKMGKFNGYKTFLVPKSLKQKLQHLKAWLLLAIPQKFHAWNQSGFAFTNKSVK
jgi:hypothetical protein